MGIEQEFERYGVKLRNRFWAVSEITESPRQLVVSLWEHNLQTVDGRWVYDDSVARWNGAGKNLLARHLEIAYREGLPLRPVVATMHNREQYLAGKVKRPRNTFEARMEWIGRVERLDGDNFLLVFDRTDEEDVTPASQPSAAKYWHLAEAVEALGAATVDEAVAWVVKHYPDDNIGDARANLTHLTVNAPARIHYDYPRTNWRSDSGHPRDRLFKVQVPGTANRVQFVPFNPAVHGHVDLQRDDHGKWRVVPLTLSEQAQEEAEAQAQAFEQLPPLDSDHDARVWAMRAVAQRRGQPLFRARLLDAYNQRCAISGCTAQEVLEAAHIQPYRGEHTHRTDNGLLLRADLHTLFDCHLLWITPELTVAMAPALRSTEYAELEGKSLLLPSSPTDHPNRTHLAEHASRCEQR